MLHDEAIEVADVDRAFRSDGAEDRGKPFVIRSKQVPAILDAEIRAMPLGHAAVDDVRGRLIDEGDAIPVPLRKSARGVEHVRRGRSEAAVHIDLPDVFAHVRRALVGIDSGQGAKLEARSGIVVALRDRQIDAALVIRGAAKDVAVFVEGESPRCCWRLCRGAPASSRPA